jgi:hypothetical protein
VCLRFESGLFIYFFPCNRAIGAFLISAFAMPQVGLDPLHFYLSRVYLRFHFLIPVSKHNLVNQVFNTILFYSRTA